ncbi:MAG: hypothetical protein DRI81_07230 [Chloroflexi bacterium]|nr:MAG: hypothetical protein DRI81_07230 [Chloroflexota bacterium]
MEQTKMSEDSMVRVNFRVSSEMRQEMKVRCAKEGKTFQEVMYGLCAIWLDCGFDIDVLRADMESGKAQELTEDFLK